MGLSLDDTRWKYAFDVNYDTVERNFTTLTP